ncbi:MAG: GNAT family N-acetyltransferase [Xanthomonadales bacterium]|nr:GNAT family N-acetyltransferase [Xanthomonadales bacterium]
MIVRMAAIEDRGAWSAMRTALWPDSDDRHLAEIDAYFAGQSHDVVEVLIAELDSEPIGFLELNIRNFAEGSRQDAVPYVEAWYVKPSSHGRGYGKRLMQAAEAWATSRGYSELASDTTPDNVQSIAIHRKLGFEETERVVCFLKKLHNG